MNIDTIYTGDSLDILKTFPDESVNCFVSSPPYFGHRDYGTDKWEGGDPMCEHRVTNRPADNKNKKAIIHGVRPGVNASVCELCGATRVITQIGLEQTPEQYVARLVAVFHEAQRVLRKDGTLWLNLGDSWASAKSRYSSSPQTLSGKSRNEPTSRNKPGLRHAGYADKQLLGIPWRVAFALQDDGWILRSDIIWGKKNPMPESVKDRVTKSHEYVFMFAKSGRYYFDWRAIQEQSSKGSHGSPRANPGTKVAKTHGDLTASTLGKWTQENKTRNKRSVWMLTSEPSTHAHYAAFPKKLIEPMILAGCPKDGIVLDPFMGSGTTALVARALGRHYVGIDLNPEYVALAQDRLRLPFEPRVKKQEKPIDDLPLFSLLAGD